LAHVKLIETASLARYFGAMLAMMMLLQVPPRKPSRPPPTVDPINHSIELRCRYRSCGPRARLPLTAANITFAKCCLAPVFRIAMAVRTLPPKANSFHG
jgi:hypothetical protein